LEIIQTILAETVTVRAVAVIQKVEIVSVTHFLEIFSAIKPVETVSAV
jgi:hypothetical protein